METNAMLLPVLSLALWTHVMWAWMYATRIPAVRRAGLQFDSQAPRGEQMSTLPAPVRWKADNYNHLMEQPTVFYAVALALAVGGADTAAHVALAWVYVGLRVAHSLVQALGNVILVRFTVFALSSLVLIALTVSGLLALAGA